MKCNYDFDFIRLFNDGLLSDEDKIKFEEHIIECNECANKLKSVKMVKNYFKNQPEINDIKDSTDRIIERIPFGRYKNSTTKYRTLSFINNILFESKYVIRTAIVILIVSLLFANWNHVANVSNAVASIVNKYMNPENDNENEKTQDDGESENLPPEEDNKEITESDNTNEAILDEELEKMLSEDRLAKEVAQFILNNAKGSNTRVTETRLLKFYNKIINSEIMDIYIDELNSNEHYSFFQNTYDSNIGHNKKFWEGIRIDAENISEYSSYADLETTKSLLQNIINSGYAILVDYSAYEYHCAVAKLIPDYKMLLEIAEKSPKEILDYLTILNWLDDWTVNFDETNNYNKRLSYIVYSCESYLNNYPDSQKMPEIKQLHAKFLLSYLFNGVKPDYDLTYRQNFWDSYKETISQYPDSQLGEMTKKLLGIIEKNNYNYSIQEANDFLDEIFPGIDISGEKAANIVAENVGNKNFRLKDIIFENGTLIHIVETYTSSGIPDYDNGYEYYVNTNSGEIIKTSKMYNSSP